MKWKIKPDSILYLRGSWYEHNAKLILLIPIGYWLHSIPAGAVTVGGDFIIAGNHLASA